MITKLRVLYLSPACGSTFPIYVFIKSLVIDLLNSFEPFPLTTYFALIKLQFAAEHLSVLSAHN